MPARFVAMLANGQLGKNKTRKGIEQRAARHTVRKAASVAFIKGLIIMGPTRPYLQGSFIRALKVLRAAHQGH